MPKKINLFHIFIASPSDAIEERNSLRNIIHEWNSLNFNSEIRFEPVLWESHSRPDSGRGQEIINRQLIDKCDFAIAIFKQKLGKGTLEEVDLFRKAKKSLMVYLSLETVTDEVSQSNEYQALQKWKNEVAWSEFLADDYFNVEDLQEKIFRNLFKLKDSIENDENFIITQDSLNFTKKDLSETYQTNSSYDVTEDRKRLRIQAKAIEDFDSRQIKKVMKLLQEGNQIIKILDVGCSDGFLTVSRFEEFENIEVVGIDISKEQINIANNENSSEKFQFKVVDVTEGLKELEFGFDLIFSAYTMHHLKNSDIIMSKLWDKLNPNGVMMVRSPDDGLKVNFPFDDNMDYLISTTDKIAGSSDRTHGRKLYTFMKRCDPKPKKIDIEYFMDDTSNLNADKREDFFEDNYGYRQKYAKQLAVKTKNPDDIQLSNKLSEIIKDQRSRFESSSEVFSISGAVLAIGYKN